MKMLRLAACFPPQLRLTLRMDSRADSHHYSNAADTAAATEFRRSGFVWLFFALLLLSFRGRAISTTHLRRSPSHLGMLASPLWIARHLIHRMRLARMTPGSGHLAGMHFRLVSTHVSSVPLLSGVDLVRVSTGFSRSRALPVTFAHIPRFVPRLFGAGCCSLALTLG